MAGRVHIHSGYVCEGNLPLSGAAWQKLLKVWGQPTGIPCSLMKMMTWGISLFGKEKQKSEKPTVKGKGKENEEGQKVQDSIKRRGGNTIPCNWKEIYRRYKLGHLRTIL